MRPLLAAAVTILTALASLAAGLPASGQPAVAGRTEAHAELALPISTAPAGTITVAYPDEPAAWLPAFHQDAAAVDLAALWGLPLYAHDDAGQLRPRLAAAATVRGPVPAEGELVAGWAVDLTLRAGQWSDGTAVTAADVVATLAALPEASAWMRAVLAPIADAAAIDERTVRVVFDEPVARWAHVLADAGPVLPAAVLASDGLEAYRDGVPVSAGSYRVSAVEPGRRRVFEAWTDGPTGPPATETIEVLTVPSYETALGLLRDGEVDAVVGHLALNPDVRVTDRLTGVVAAATFGGTVVTWRWDAEPDGRPRDAVHAALRLDAFAQGLLGEYGEVADDLVDGVSVGRLETPQEQLADLSELVLAAPRSHEAVAFAARAARDAIERRGGTVRVVSEEGDELLREGIGNAQVVVRRLGPWPSLLALHRGGLRGPSDEPLPELVIADHLTRRDADRLGEAMAVLLADADELPLVRVAVAHAWSDEVTGLRPSGWPGAAFWSVAQWRSGAG